MTWRDIESAPKDGTEIDLARGDRVTSGSWYEQEDYFDAQQGQMTELVDPHWMTWDGGFTKEEPPTHWKPKSPPPGEGVVVSCETEVMTDGDDGLQLESEPKLDGFNIGDRVSVTVSKITQRVSQS